MSAEGRHLDHSYKGMESRALWPVLPHAAPFAGTDVVKKPKPFM